MAKDVYLAHFSKILAFKLNLMGLNILSETFAATKMTVLVCAGHASLMIALTAYLLGRLDDLPSQQITELVVTLVLYVRLCSYLTSLLALNLKWKSLIDRIDCERELSCVGSEEARQLSTMYSKREYLTELVFDGFCALALIAVMCGNAVIETNSYRLPFNFCIDLFPAPYASITWTVNYLFQAVTIFFGGFVFFSYSSALFIVLDHSCWGIDTLKLLIEKLSASVGDDEALTEMSRREIIAQQLAAIHEAHLNVLKWNKDVQELIQLNFLFEFSIFSGLICLCIYTVAEDPLESVYMQLLLIVLLVQLFAFCWMGSRVLDRIDELITTVYDVKWYLLSVREAKAIQMILRASQDMKGFRGVFKRLSMTTFQQVLEFSYSLLALLRTMN